MKVRVKTSLVLTQDGFRSLSAGDEVDLPAGVAQSLVAAGNAVAVEAEKPKPPRGKRIGGAPENKDAS